MRKGGLGEANLREVIRWTRRDIIITSFGFIFARYGVVRKGGLGEADLREVIRWTRT